MEFDLRLPADSDLADLLPVVRSEGRIDRNTCIRLWKTSDLTSLGALANLVRQRKSGDSVLYRAAVHVNYTRRPIPSCPGCDEMSRGREGELISFEELDDILRPLKEAAPFELHLAGGADPETDLGYMCGLVRRAHEAVPGLNLRAFTWSELQTAAEVEGKRADEVMTALSEAGLRTLAGGMLADLTPEAPHLDARSLAVMGQKLPWIEAADALSFSADLSWMYGDADDPAVISDTLILIRDIQDRFGIFECIAPMPYMPPAEAGIEEPTAYDQLRAIAVARLMMDNISRVRICPAAINESLLQVALWYGADDLGSVPPVSGTEDRSRCLSRERLRHLIWETGRRPVDAFESAPSP